MAKMMSREEMLAQVRKKMAERSSKSNRDKDEFRPPKANQDQTLEYYFRILPELGKGDKCASGICDRDFDLWYYENGSHWHNKKKTECPRCHDQGHCELCQFGFDLLDKEQDKQVRSRISKNFLAKGMYAVNIYFINHPKNPDDMRGKVMWYNAPRTVWGIWDETINSDDSGDEEEPRACGIFYHPLEGYTFKLVVKRRDDYNNYEKSCFMASTLGPLVKKKDGGPDEARIAEIMAGRHILTCKFEERSQEKVAEILNMVKKSYSGDTDDGEEVKFEKKRDVEEIVEELTDDDKQVKAEVDEELKEADGEQVGEEVEEAVEEVMEEIEEKPKKSKPQPQSQPTKPQSQPTKKKETKVEKPDEEDPELTELLSQIEN
jgi:hypothetical protein